MKKIFQVFFIGLTAMLGFWGCHSFEKLASEQLQTAPSADTAGVNYTLIYLIHGDSNYLYHGQEGQSLQADGEQLGKAISVAQKVQHGEVFIFHQRPEKKILWLFPKKDRVFWHFRNGELIRQKKYSPGSKTESFKKESQLYKQYRSGKSSRVFLLYFGHEIPGKEGVVNYHHSRPDAKFTAQTFAEGARSFLEGSDDFDLTVLSTCDNGTPVMVSELQSVTKFLLASPQNLHLSHIDARAILQLEQNPIISASAIADSIAQNTYRRLSDFIQTAVTLSVYDMQAVSKYVDSLSNEYIAYQQQSATADVELENTDCAVLPFWPKEKSKEGVSAWYKAPNFGRQAGQKTHSGWGCQE